LYLENETASSNPRDRRATRRQAPIARRAEGWTIRSPETYEPGGPVSIVLLLATATCCGCGDPMEGPLKEATARGAAYDEQLTKAFKGYHEKVKLDIGTYDMTFAPKARIRMFVYKKDKERSVFGRFAVRTKGVGTDGKSKNFAIDVEYRWEAGKFVLDGVSYMTPALKPIAQADAPKLYAILSKEID
jgi:hypothetical protein